MKSKRAEKLLRLALGLLLIVYFFVGGFLIVDTGLTTDEVAHLSGSHSIVDGRPLNPEHPHLVKALNAGVIKVFFDDYKTDSDLQWSRGKDFLLETKAPISRVLGLSRMVYLIYNSGFLIFLLIYTYRLKFLRPGYTLLLSLFYVFSPSFFSHGSLLTFDVAGSWTAFVSILSGVYCLKILREKSTKRHKLEAFLYFFLSSAIALNSKYSNFILVLPCLFIVWRIIAIAKNKKSFLNTSEAIGLISYGLVFVTTFTWVLNSIVSYNYLRFLGFWKPFFVYFNGFFMVLRRTGDTSLNYYNGQIKVIRYWQLVERVFWYKENPVLIIVLFLVLLLGGFYTIFKFSRISRYLRQTKNLERLVLFISFPLLYWLVAWDSKFTIGYRHFYPILIFIYAFLAWGLVTLTQNLKGIYKKIFTSLIGGLAIMYVIYGLLGLQQNLTYTNPFWNQPKWELIDDSTISWGQDDDDIYRYIKENDLFKTKDYSISTGKGWNLVIASRYRPNTLIQMTPLIGRQRLQYPEDPFFDITETRLTDIKDKDYLIVDYGNFQSLVSLSNQNDQLALENLVYLESLEPIYQRNGVVWLFKLTS